jgi:hypothetical protein
MKCEFCKQLIKKGKAYPLVERRKLREVTVCEDCFYLELIKNKDIPEDGHAPKL